MPEPRLTREWLVTNGFGGYASGTVAGLATRRYHGYLIASLPSPLGRVVMLDQLEEWVTLPAGGVVQLGAAERAGHPPDLPGASHLAEFRLEAGLPIWRHECVSGANRLVLERRVLMPHLQNTVHVAYRLLSGDGPVRLAIRPAMHFRSHDAPLGEPLAGPYRLSVEGQCYEASAGGDFPPLRMLLRGEGTTFVSDEQAIAGVFYRYEASRGYPAVGDLWSPGHFEVDLALGHEATLVASTEIWRVIHALGSDDALAAERQRRQSLLREADPTLQAGLAAELVLAADQFIIQPVGRTEDEVLARAAGDEVRSVIAGYHWFTDWGRDTMISLEGLTLLTGRHLEAGYILRTFAHHIRDGLIPNLFPEGSREGLYHTADATLWLFHALDRYLAATDDRATLSHVLPRLLDVVEHHLRGTRFGIGVDPADGLLRQGQEGYQLTWMDAKVGDWVVTPRRGKAVEINALWYNALRLLEGWVREEHGTDAARRLAEHAERARRSFDERFWYAAGGYLYDVVDGPTGDDPALRPNQLLAISLSHPVLDRARWQPVVEVVQHHLLTPVGLRSLAPGHPDFRPTYDGDLRSRDAAYHQGTVWAWLIGPFVDAWLKVHPGDRAGARRYLEGFESHLGEAGLGTIGEIFDAEPPYTPRGCIAQAWSVAEVLKCWARTSEVVEST